MEPLLKNEKQQMSLWLKSHIRKVYIDVWNNSEMIIIVIWCTKKSNPI